MTDHKDTLDLLEKAKQQIELGCGKTAYSFIDQALAKLRKEPPHPCNAVNSELTTWLRKTISLDRYEKGDKELQAKVREACDRLDTETQRADKAEARLKAMYVGDLAPESRLSGYKVITNSLRDEVKQLEAKLKKAEAENKSLNKSLDVAAGFDEDREEIIEKQAKRIIDLEAKQS